MWGSGVLLVSDSSLIEGMAVTSAAFCNPAAGLAALLSLVSATDCDIQTRAGDQTCI